MAGFSPWHVKAVHATQLSEAETKSQDASAYARKNTDTQNLRNIAKTVTAWYTQITDYTGVNKTLIDTDKHLRNRD
jgi:hypothetical protein